MIRLLAALLLFIGLAARAEAKPVISAGDTSVSAVGLHCVFPITRTLPATSYSDISYSTSGPAGAAVNGTLRFLRGDTKKPIAIQSLAPGQFTLTIHAVRYATIGRATATCTVAGVTPPIPPTPIPPIPTPIPPSGQADIPSPGLDGKTLLVPHDYTTDLEPYTGTPPPDSAPDNLGAYRQICGDGFFSADDPVLYPGQPGKSHVHDFSGKKTIDVSAATPESLTADDAHDSTCNNNPLGHSSQNSLYWVAALTDGAGNWIRPDYNSLYYKRVPSTNPDCGMPTGTGSGPVGICTADPGGLQMITGMNPATGKFSPANYRTDAGRQAYFSCSAGATANTTFANLEDIAAANPQCTELTEVIAFPNCWDGKNLWKVDRSHLVYMVNYNTDGKFRCPVSNPYLITQVTIHYVYTIDANWQKYDLSCTPQLRLIDPTAKRGACLHADAMLAWDSRVKAKRVNGCIERHLNCSAGDLDGIVQFKGAAQPVYGFKQPASQRLVPMNAAPMLMKPSPAVINAGERG